MILTLNDSSNKLVFDLTNTLSYIIVKKISVKSDEKNPSDKIDILSSIFLRILYKNKNGDEVKNIINVGKFVTAKQRNPLVTTDIIIPFENSENFSAFKPHYNYLEIEINEDFKGCNVELEIDKTPGVIIR